MKYTFFFLVALIFSATTASSGRLGVCYKCEYQAYGQTLEVFNWSGENTLGLNLDITGRAKCGGGEIPSKISRAPAEMCDATGGILRWANNDPFDPACKNGSGNHKFHIGGENKDLVVIVEQGDTFRSGAFYRVQDGKGYSCADDVRGGRNFSTLRYGKNRDLLDIYVVNERGVTRNQFRIEDGRNHIIVSTPTMIGRLYGKNGDVISLYHVGKSGEISILGGIRIKDGVNYSLHALGNDIGVVYGRNRDVRGRFCFEQGAWKQHMGSRNGAFPKSCEPLPAANESNGIKPGIDFLLPGQTRLP